MYTTNINEPRYRREIERYLSLHGDEDPSTYCKCCRLSLRKFMAVLKSDQGFHDCYLSLGHDSQPQSDAIQEGPLPLLFFVLDGTPPYASKVVERVEISDGTGLSLKL